MELKNPDILYADVLIIGGGGAGLRAAIEARKHDLEVALVSESAAGFRSNTAISAAALAVTGTWKGHGDSPEAHSRDTMAGGRFVNDRKMVERMARGAAHLVRDLRGCGVEFREIDGEVAVHQQPGHSYPRNVNVAASRGVNITRPLLRYAAGAGVRFIEGVLVAGLLRDEGEVAGALGIDDKGNPVVLWAKSVILATGGAGGLYLRSDNARGITGDGYAIAYRAGATLRDMEFTQFYPTTWGQNGSRLFLYERVLPHGATIRNSAGEDILERHGMGDFVSVTRDKLTRAIMKEIAAGRGVNGHVLFDLAAIPEEKARELHESGLLRMGRYPDRLPVAPALHFFMGGVKVDEGGWTGIEGLYAAGEVCGGTHGANRLAGNALTEMFVFGAIAGEAAAIRASEAKRRPVPRHVAAAELGRLSGLASESGGGNLGHLEGMLKQTMWDRAGVIRDRKSLDAALGEIKDLREQIGSASTEDARELCRAVKLGNMLTVGEMVCRAALTRTESRGAHYRTDYPEEDERWLETVEISCRDGEMRAEVVAVNGGEGL